MYILVGLRAIGPSAPSLRSAGGALAPPPDPLHPTVKRYGAAAKAATVVGQFEVFSYLSRTLNPIPNPNKLIPAGLLTYLKSRSMSPNPSLRFGCLFMRTKSIKKQVFKKRKKHGWRMGMGRKGRPDPRSSDPSVFIIFLISAFFTRFSPRE